MDLRLLVSPRLPLVYPRPCIKMKVVMLIQFPNRWIAAIRAAGVADCEDNIRMMTFEAKYGEKGRHPVENRPKCLLLIAGEGIKVMDLKEKN
jgi:hypothetical protein